MKIAKLGITATVAILAGAGLSGCASDRSDAARYSQVSYTQPAQYSGGRWIDPPANRYYDPRSQEPSGRGPQ